MNWFKRFFTPPLIVAAAILIWVEEALWRWLKKLTGWIALVPFVRRLEELILQLPPYAAMGAFLLPMVTLFPLKLLAVYWLTRGLWLASLTLIVVAKVLGTAIVARMYVVCQPKLMTIAWFRRLHDGLIATRDRLYAAVRSLPLYQMARTRLIAIKLAVNRILKPFRSRRGVLFRWRAIRRWHRQKNKRP